MSKLVEPESTIGIIGGGQLGRMIGIAAKQMGYKIAVLEPIKNGPCAQIADYEINTKYDDVAGLRKLLEISDVVTYEFENISSNVIERVQSYGYLPQGIKPLIISQNRKIEKTVINALGHLTAPFEIVKSKDELKHAVQSIKLPAVLKTTTGGYDGKGQVVIKSEDDFKKCDKLLEQECILERYINFEKEISVVVTRSVNNEVKVFPIGENIHINNILHQTIVPAKVAKSVKENAQAIAIDLMEKLDFIGTMAIEMFVTKDDEILINEIAPRPHNSGHYTIEGCFTSQFEQHVRAICGLKLGNCELRQPIIMINLLGQHMDRIPKIIENEQFNKIKLHIYGKEIIKHNRKMGHITICGEEQDKLLEGVNQLLLLLDMKGE